MSNENALRRQIALVIYQNPPEWVDDPYGLEESGVLAASVLPIIRAEVKRAQAQALRDAADYIDGKEPKHLGDLDVDPLDYGTGSEYGIDCAAAWLHTQADRYEKEQDDV